MDEPIPFLIFLIPIVAIVFGTVTSYLKHRDKIRATAAVHAQSDTERLAKLEERVQILERIVTDRGHELDQKINALSN